MKKRFAILMAIAALLSVGLVNLFLRVDFIPRPYSPERQTIDGLLQLLFAIASVFFSIIVVVLADTLIFFRRRRGDDTDGPPVLGHAHLEFAWTLVPLVIVVVLGAYSGMVLHRLTSPPPPPQTEMQIDVLAFRFGWQFTYPEYGGIQSFELELPVDRPVVLNLQSRDVIHAFWVPEFGPKQDAVPGMTTYLRFTPTQTGRYTVYCSQLCGFGHTYMLSSAVVVSPDDFQKWVDAQPKPK